MKRVNWGILSTAHIATTRVIPGLQQSAWCEVSAIASRTLEHAQQSAAQLGIAKAFGSYEALIADPDIEAIYNPLPNHLHVPYTLLAAQAGKHVLCEKPIALSAAEAESLRAVASRVHIMEAFMVRFHPQWLRARELVRSGQIGTVRSIQVAFSYFNDDARDIRNQAAMGGGALYDIGCYPVAVGRWLFDTEPLRAIALVNRDPRFHTDRTTSALLDFGEGRHLDFTVSTQSAPFQRVQIFGARQRIDIEIPFSPPNDSPTRLLIDDGRARDGSSAVSECFAACDHYTLQGEVFSRAVRGELALPYGLDDAVQNMRVIDALFRSELSGRWESV